MDLRPVRDAYADRWSDYAALFGGAAQPRDLDGTALIRRHLEGVPGRLLDLGCGPGQWTAYLHARGADVVGIDLVEDFLAHARRTYPGPEFRLGSLTDVALAEFRRLLAHGGVLVLGFFDSDDGVAAFDHAVVTAYRWPADVMAARLAQAGFVEVQRVQHETVERPDRKYAAIAATACWPAADSGTADRVRRPHTGERGDVGRPIITQTVTSVMAATRRVWTAALPTRVTRLRVPQT